ncbi:MAG TPA: hypothetical protein VF170_18885 [Planctomycetaceae bacterium]
MITATDAGARVFRGPVGHGRAKRQSDRPASAALHFPAIWSDLPGRATLRRLSGQFTSFGEAGASGGGPRED